VRSSNGQYYPGLDHLRALAAFLVFGWHFTHGFSGIPAPFGPTATPFLAPFNEGHCGVALFMCLSGYLFAKILSGKRVVWRLFYWNRFLRLVPLLVLGFALFGAKIASTNPAYLTSFGRDLLTGFIRPTWPLGAWSIAVEAHFYLLLWIILPLQRRWLPSLFCIAGVGFVTRLLIYLAGGDVAYYGYFTIVGRIDQFVLGITAWHFRSLLAGRHGWMAVATVVFFVIYQWFVVQGGYNGTQGARFVWVYIPTVEAAYFSFLVAYYDATFAFARTWYWRLAEAIGAASYSIYLLHTFIVFNIAEIASRHVPGIRTWEVSEAVALVMFCLFAPVAWLSYRWMELPFLRFRTRYTVPEPTATSLENPSLAGIRAGRRMV
jgi:peptidoglycan/LPS O-acetylase OafA/YrhL